MRRKLFSLLSVSVLFLLALGSGLLNSAVCVGAPAIVITNLPAYGAHGNMSGYVTNADVTTNCLVAFIYVAGDWYSKPGCASQLTPIQADGSWSVNISPNANDVNATEIAAFLVPTNYSLACVNGTAGLTIPASALATVYANRYSPTTRHINFSDYGWTVRSSGGSVVGPGPNYFNDSTNNVWLDAQGLLHMQINYTNSGWQCEEIISDRTFGYGQYRFTVSAAINSLDASAVLGLFTYSNDSTYNDREIDIELSRWNYAFGSNNVADYAVAPYNNGQLLRFAVSNNVVNSEHSFVWQSNNIVFQSLNGNFTNAPAASNVLQGFTCVTGVPPVGGEQVHINLWLNKGNAPVNGQPIEVVISNFNFVPLGTPPAAKLSLPGGLPGGPVKLSVQSQPDWHYQIFSTSNFFNWLALGTVLATNNQFQFNDTNSVGNGARFYRAWTKP